MGKSKKHKLEREKDRLSETESWSVTKKTKKCLDDLDTTSKKKKKKSKKKKISNLKQTDVGDETNDSSIITLNSAFGRTYRAEGTDDSDPDSDFAQSSAESSKVKVDLESSQKQATRQHTLLISVDKAEDRYPMLFNEGTKSWSTFIDSLMEVTKISEKDSPVITYKLHGANIILTESTFNAFCFHMRTSNEQIHFLNVTIRKSGPFQLKTKIKETVSPSASCVQVREATDSAAQKEDILKLLDKKEWDKAVIARLSRDQRVTAMKTLLKSLLTDTMCTIQTSKCNHKVRTLSIKNIDAPEGIEKKLRSLLTAEEINSFFNKRAKFKSVYGNGNLLLNPLMAQCPICMSLVSLSHLNDIMIKDDNFRQHIESAHQKDSVKSAYIKGKLKYLLIYFSF